jgi:hypothetical protein
MYIYIITSFAYSRDRILPNVFQKKKESKSCLSKKSGHLASPNTDKCIKVFMPPTTRLQPSTDGKATANRMFLVSSVNDN